MKVDADAELESATSRKPWTRSGAWAHARLMSPHALLTTVLQRVLIAVLLRGAAADRGDHASLNLFVAVTAPTAGGRTWHRRGPADDRGLVDLLADTEGRGRNKHTIMDRDAVLLRVSEVDTLAALGGSGRTPGSTLLSMLRSAHMGQRSGSPTAKTRPPSSPIPIGYA